MPRVWLFAAYFCLVGIAGWAEDPTLDFADQLPRVPPVEAADALPTFVVAPGYQMQLAASEPLVTDPVAMAFDEFGRLFVVEMRGYSEQGDEHLGSVRRLSDDNHDGHFDRSTVFIDNLAWPTGVCCFDGGVFVAVAPDILYCQDTDGDGRADVREIVFTGFGRSNVQGLLNSLEWGLDHRIHGATSSSGAMVRKPHEPEAAALSLRGRDFSFDPHTLEIRAETGGGQHGLTFDRWGRKYICHNSDHLQMVVIDDRYLARNPYYALDRATESIATDGPQAEVYRQSPVEAWRTIRTRLRVAGQVPGPIEGGGRAAGYFTSATGVTIYDGDAWLDDDRAEIQAIVGDVGSNIIHRKRVVPNGVSCRGSRIRQRSEFIASTDIWFRPVQFCNGPDGALYVADFYREVIEHPNSLPPVIKKHLDLTSGRDRGRIYRIVPSGFQTPVRPLPGDATPGELAAMLAHENGWHRRTAARLLFERQPQHLYEELQILARQSTPIGKVRALHMLQGLGQLTAETLGVALGDSHPRVREHAVRLAEPFLTNNRELAAKVLTLVADADSRVRFQVALSLGYRHNDEVAAALARLIRRDGGDQWMQAAVFSSAVDVAEPLRHQLTGNDEWPDAQVADAVLGTLGEIVDRKQHGAGEPSAELPATRVTTAIQQSPQKQDVIRRYRESLGNQASLERGAKIFQRQCAVCHDLDTGAGGIAPSVASFRNRGLDFILTNVLDPNREINPQYLNYSAITADGLVATGMITAETATSVTLASARDKVQTLLRIDIEEIRSTGRSLMPENFDEEINEQQMADLLQFLLQAN